MIRQQQHMKMFSMHWRYNYSFLGFALYTLTIWRGSVSFPLEAVCSLLIFVLSHDLLFFVSACFLPRFQVLKRLVRMRWSVGDLRMWGCPSPCCYMRTVLGKPRLVSRLYWCRKLRDSLFELNMLKGKLFAVRWEDVSSRQTDWCYGDWVTGWASWSSYIQAIVCYKHTYMYTLHSTE